MNEQPRNEEQRNEEQRMDKTLRDFYFDDASRAHDRHALLRDVRDTVSHTPQRRRRWWWPFRRHATVTSTPPSPELQPELTSVKASGQAPSAHGSVPAVYGAMKFVVAAAIIAVFGGFLYLGVLAPGEGEPVPGVVSSASPVPSPISTDAGPSPTPGPTEDPDTATIPTSLAASEPSFVAEQVEPGVERIISDGADFDITTLDENVVYAFEDIATGTDGAVWVVGHRYHTDIGRPEGPFAWELGTPGMTGAAEGFPSDPQKLIVDEDGEVVVSAPMGIKAFDGSAWVDSPGTRRVRTGGGTIWFVEPDEVGAIGGGDPVAHTGGPLVLSSDLVGYLIADDVGYRFMREWPTWWESCSARDIGYRNGTGCIDREAADERGLGAGHDDESRSLYLSDTVTGRLARAADGSIWVVGGPSVEDLIARRTTEGGAIYRIDPGARGFECDGC